MEPSPSAPADDGAAPDNVYAPPQGEEAGGPLSQPLDITPRELKRLRNHSLNISAIGILLTLGFVINVVVLVMMATGALDSRQFQVEPPGPGAYALQAFVMVLILAGVYGCMFRASLANRTIAIIVMVILVVMNLINLASPPYELLANLGPFFSLLIVTVALTALIGGRRLYGPDRLPRRLLSKRGLREHREAWEARVPGERRDDGEY